MADSPISRYEIIAHSLDNSAGMVTVSTMSSVTIFNVTGLLPGTAYELTVVTVSEGGDVIAKSPESESAQATTEFTGMCTHLSDIELCTVTSIKNMSASASMCASRMYCFLTQFLKYCVLILCPLMVSSEFIGPLFTLVALI